MECSRPDHGCHKKHQRITYAGVGAHHQNGVAERRIRVLQDLARAQMAHASQRWPEAMAANLWPYAIRIANHEWNQAPNPREISMRSASQLFHKTDTQRNAKHPIWMPSIRAKGPTSTKSSIPQVEGSSEVRYVLGTITSSCEKHIAGDGPRKGVCEPTVSLQTRQSL